MVMPARIAIAGAVLCAVVGLSIAVLGALDRAFPPPLADTVATSVEVRDRNGRLLRAFAAEDGTWRLAVSLDDVDPAFLDMLVAYEDKRFRSHHGVDPIAVTRAAAQLLVNGRIVSGGSTITMQLARLLEPREERSVSAKLRQMLRALQIERRLSKDEILELYLTLAPYGGNLEGIRAASLAWYGKEPKRLGLGEAALLVSIPQSPERRRPDRHADEARAARDRVLQRMAQGLLDRREAQRAEADRVPLMRRDMPALAAHATGDAVRAAPDKSIHRLTIRGDVQAALERVAREAAAGLGSRVSVAMVMADAHNGEILASVGAADFLDNRRDGWVDMTTALRSPGSTLKPFVYALAMEEGLVAQETVIADRPSSFSGYRPRNFDMAYQGDVSIRTALQLSLNVPAVALLDAVGPLRLSARFRAAGVTLAMPRDEPPGLAIALGGAGTTLRDLVQLYTSLANGGEATALHLDDGAPASRRLLDPRSAWQVGDMLSAVAPPEGAARNGIAYKTGTSYGYRDAWSVGYDGRHVLGVWVGRPDGGPVPGITGYTTAAPILFEAFDRSGVPVTPLPKAPPGALRLAREQLPVTLQRFEGPRFDRPRGVAEPAPQIVFPPQGARVELAGASGAQDPLVLKLEGGRAPFRWLANGRPLAEPSRRRVGYWVPDGNGYSTLTVIDAAGRTASVDVFVEAAAP